MGADEQHKRLFPLYDVRHRRIEHSGYAADALDGRRGCRDAFDGSRQSAQSGGVQFDSAEDVPLQLRAGGAELLQLADGGRAVEKHGLQYVQFPRHRLSDARGAETRSGVQPHAVQLGGLPDQVLPRVRPVGSRVGQRRARAVQLRGRGRRDGGQARPGPVSYTHLATTSSRSTPRR